MSVPVMRMGLVGFADERQLRNLLATRNRNLQWERWPFIDADALWINGENAQPLRGNMVRVPSVEAGKQAIVLNLKEIDRPTAFTLPIGNGYFTPPLAFDPHKVEQVADVLNQFEAELLDVAVDLTLAAEISRRRHELASPSYHLTVQGRLVAVFSVTGEIGLAQQLSPYELAHAEWAGRPAAGADVPGHFRHTSMAQVMWNYVMRNVDDLLPSRYREGTMYWRRMPAVPTKWVREEHMMLISVLSTGPQTVQSLVDQTGFSEATVGQTLAALYFGGSLTTDPRKAGPTLAPVKPRKDDDWPSSMTSTFVAPQSTAPPRPGKRSRADMPTVPAPLEKPGKE
ncbi:MAG TPA: hypothetical protein VMZ74_04235 [Ramlibacter sp.]|nr:hypothetical protein [Ramlibacter sp.]